MWYIGRSIKQEIQKKKKKENLHPNCDGTTTPGLVNRVQDCDQEIEAYDGSDNGTVKCTTSQNHIAESWTAPWRGRRSLRGANGEQDEKSNLLVLGDLQRPDHGYRDGNDQDVGDDAQRRRGLVHCRAVDA